MSRTVLSRADVVTLVQRCLDGDERAWAVLVERYENLVYSTALATGLDVEAAAEVHQRVWVELHRSLPRLRDPTSLPKWLITTARRQAYEQSVRGSAGVIELGDELIDPGPSSEALIVELQERQRVHEALARLEGRCRRLVDMLFFEVPRPDYREIAARFDVAIGTLGSMRARCLERLRRLMEEPR